jgi:pilus assembly protein Flp/PilA
MEYIQQLNKLPISLKIWVDTILADVLGQDLIEYALMAGFVAVTSGALMPGISTNISKIFSTVGSVMTNAKNQGS